MKHYIFGLLVFLFTIATSCTDNTASIGGSIQPDSDIIEFAADTFHLSTDTMLVDCIYAIPDSFLLGNYYNEKYGSTRAEIFAQLKAPINFNYHQGSRPDSAEIIIAYYSWFGDGNSPMRINIYEMKGEPFTFSGSYPSNISVAEYADLSKPLASQVIVAKDATRGDSTLVVFKLSQEFVDRFFAAGKSIYASDESFFNFFKGLYITTDFGSSTILSVSSIRLNFYYSYDFVSEGETLNIPQTVMFPANREVRQVNHIEHPDRKDVIKPEEGKSYISSPANIFTRVKIPLKKMNDRMNDSINYKKLVLNSASLQVEVTDFEYSKLALQPPRYMLLIKESMLSETFEKNKIPTSANDTSAIYAEYKEGLNNDGDTVRFYAFNLSVLIANELKIAEKANQSPPELLDMVLVPFTPDYLSSSSSISRAKQMIPMSGVTIKGGSNADSPMRIKTVFSGF